MKDYIGVLLTAVLALAIAGVTWFWTPGLPHWVPISAAVMMVGLLIWAAMLYQREPPSFVDADVGLTSAIAYLATGDWNISFALAASGVGIVAADNAVSDIRQLAHDDQILVKGRLHPTAVYQKLEPAFWEHNRFNWQSLLEDRPVTETDNGSLPFHDLMMNRAQVVALRKTKRAAWARQAKRNSDPILRDQF